MTPDKAAGAVPQGGDDGSWVSHLCIALKNMGAGDRLSRQQAAWLDDTRKLLREQAAAIAERDARIAELERAVEYARRLAADALLNESAEAQLSTLTARLGELAEKWRAGASMLDGLAFPGAAQLARAECYRSCADALRLAATTGATP